MLGCELPGNIPDVPDLAAGRPVVGSFEFSQKQDASAEEPAAVIGT